MTRNYALSDAARAMHRKLKKENKLISANKETIISTHIAAAVRHANKLLGIGGQLYSDKCAQDSLWTQYYHAEIDRSLKKEGLRVDISPLW